MQCQKSKRLYFKLSDLFLAKKKRLKICCYTLLLRSRSELKSLGVSVYFTSQKFVACLRSTAKLRGTVGVTAKLRGMVRVTVKVCGMVRVTAKVRGMVRVTAKDCGMVKA